VLQSHVWSYRRDRGSIRKGLVCMKFNPARKPCSFRVDAILRRKGVIGENMTFNEKKKERAVESLQYEVPRRE